MPRRAHLMLMAEYNASMNRKLYAAAAKLPPRELLADRGAFFGSIAGTLNHLLAADTIWLRRFAAHPDTRLAQPLAPVLALPQPSGLDQVIATDLPVLRARRLLLDGIISQWVSQLREHDLDGALAYRNARGDQRKPFFSLLMHFFNHQTHHRGQITTLLSQAGVDIGITDLLEIVPDA